MYKKLKRSLIIFMTTTILLTGCAPSEEKMSQNISELQAEISTLQDEKSRLETEIKNTKIEKGIAKYVITFKIKQSHLTLDIGQHLKDEMNEITIQIPVDKEYYDTVEIGDVINDDFRMGSFIFKGSIGSWKITVKDKEIL